MKKLFQMKNLKLSNKKYLSVILLYLFFGLVAQSQEPIDIWNIEQKNAKENTDTIESNEKKMVCRTTFIKCNPKKMTSQI